MDILTSRMEVGVAFVEFRTIVVAIHVSLGKPLTQFQVSPAHFYIETGLWVWLLQFRATTHAPQERPRAYGPTMGRSTGPLQIKHSD